MTNLNIDKFDFSNDIFQAFLKLPDKEVEKILKNCNNDNYNYFYTYTCNVVNLYKKTYANNSGIFSNDYSYSRTSLEPFDYATYCYVKSNYIKYILKPTEQKIISIKNLLYFYFGEEFVDIQRIDEDIIDFIIYFPKINITNSIGMEHTIKDLYFKFSYWYDKIACSLTRTSVSKKEYYRKYMHSHAQGNRTLGTFSELCFGNTSLRKAADNLNKGFNLKDFKYLVHNLYGFLAWESIEGNPFISINTILKNNYIGENTYFLSPDYDKVNRYYNSLLKYIKNNNIFLNIEYPNLVSSNELKDILLEGNIIDTEDLFYFGKYKSFISTYDDLNLKDVHKERSFTFKGVPVEYKLINDKEEQEPPILEPHKEYVASLADKINKDLKLFILNYTNNENTGN